MEIEFPPGMPEEQKDFYRRQIELAQMSWMDAELQAKSFFDKLDPHDIIVLRRIFDRCGQAPLVAAFWEGYLVNLAETKFNVCGYCALNHEADREAAMIAHGMVPSGTIAHPAMGGPVPPWQPQEETGGIVDGRRVETCSTCHGDRGFKVCDHPPGQHGQGGFCPEPTVIPCPECRTPHWYTRDELEGCMRPGCNGQLVPLKEPGMAQCHICFLKAPVSG